MSDYTLTYGSHRTREDGMCLMEAVAYLAGEPHTDAPMCACPILTTYAIALNDAMGQGPDGDALRAQYLYDLAPMLVGSRSTPDVEQARTYVLIDHAIRVFAPLALESAGLDGEAARLRALGAVIDQRSAWSASEDASRAASAAARVTATAGWATAAACAAYAAARATARGGWATDGAAWAAAAAWAADDAAAAWAAARAALVAALEAAP